MKTEWDYTELADAYLKRPNYSESSIDQMLDISGIKDKDRVCDIGAGVAHLTMLLAKRGFSVIAIEPNNEMRKRGIDRTLEYLNVAWVEATAEETFQETSLFNLVTFGSSFNVVKRELALMEASRILKPGGWFACVWNHRDLLDPIQFAIEDFIKSSIKDYNYGSRREDQAHIIKSSGLFEQVNKIEAKVFHKQSIADCVGAWRSHCTLYRQAGEKFNDIISGIEKILFESGSREIIIPYITCIWLAKVKK